MSNHYCVFWYPTIFHREKKDRGVRILSQSIADIDENKDVKAVLLTDLCLQIKKIPCEKDTRNNEECFDLEFTLKGKDKDEKKIETTFHHYDHSRNGFVIYWYDRDQLLNDFWNSFLAKENIGETIDALRNIFSNRIKERYPIVLEKPLSDECVKNHTIDWLLISFYHLAKSFYHEHEVHDEADAKLESYYYKKIDSDGHRVYLTEPPSLSTKNNPVINRYLDQYEQMFINYAERVSKDYRDRKADIDEFLIQRRDILEALNNKVPKKSDISNLITLLGSTFKKIKPIDSKVNQQSSNDAMGSSVCGERPLPGEDNTPLPSPDDLIKENRPSFNKNVEELKEELKEKVIEVYLPFVNHLYTQVSSLSKICHDALIEYTYCRTLLGSKYNDDYKHDSLFTQSEVEYLSDNPFQYSRPSIRDNRRKKAFNIRNSIRYIEDIRQKCSLLESTLTKILIEEVHGISKDNTDILSQIKILGQKNTKTLMSSEKSNRLSYALGFLSLGFGIVSLIRPEEGNEIITIVLRVFGALSFVAAVCFGISTLFVSKENKSRKD